MSKDVIAIVAIVSVVSMDCGFPRGCKTFKRDKLAKNDNLTVCRNFIGISYNHFAFSKPAVLVPLTGDIVE